MPDFAFPEPLALAGRAVVLVVMSQAQESDVILIVVGVVMIQMSDLPRLDTQISIQTETNAAPPSAQATITGTLGRVIPR